MVLQLIINCLIKKIIIIMANKNLKDGAKTVLWSALVTAGELLIEYLADKGKNKNKG